MTEQTNRHREAETRKTREIAQLRKAQRRQENTVKSLQAQVQIKEQILKRKNEEVSALRRSQRGRLSQRAAGRNTHFGTSKSDTQMLTFNTRAARHRWDDLSRAIARAARNKQAVIQLEKELERLVSEREALCTELANVRCRQRSARSAELANEEDTIKSNLNYVQDNIEQVQQSIMELEENKDVAPSEDKNLQNVIANVRSVEEAKFLLERLTDSAILFSCNSAVNEVRLLEHETMLKEIKQESGIQQQLLHHFLTQNNDVQISDLFESLNLGINRLGLNPHLSSSQKSLVSNGTYDIPCEGNTLGNDMSTSLLKSRSRSNSPTPNIDFASRTLTFPLNHNQKFSRRNFAFESIGSTSSESNSSIDDKSC